MNINLEGKTKGVSLDRKTNQFRARITTPTKRLFLGRFQTKRDAIVARKTAEVILKELGI